MSEQSITMPSGKQAGDENFPVGSLLLPKALRGTVMRFYRFARTIDDIADSPDLTAQEKVSRLDRFAAALEGHDNDPALGDAIQLRENLDQRGITHRHAQDLISAFKQDATKSRYASWEELLDYCDRSANPVGRFLLDLHGESRELYATADALCTALQILNHLQDCQDDFRQLDRVYLPEDWMDQAQATREQLKLMDSTSALTEVFSRCHEGVEALMTTARTLPQSIQSRRLAMEAAVTVRLADRLLRLLRQHDPLANRVRLRRWDFVAATLLGSASGLLSPKRAAP